MAKNKTSHQAISNLEKTKQAIKPYLTWKMLISFGIAWLIFAGWAIAFVVIGIISDNAWFYSIGGGFLGWVIIPNGSFMIPFFVITPIVHKLLFGKKPLINKGEVK